VASTVECPHCKGRIGHRRNQSLFDALCKHIDLTHPGEKLPATKGGNAFKNVILEGLGSAFRLPEDP
jgi:hypothetical protein